MFSVVLVHFPTAILTVDQTDGLSASKMEINAVDPPTHDPQKNTCMNHKAIKKNIVLVNGHRQP